MLFDGFRFYDDLRSFSSPRLDGGPSGLCGRATHFGGSSVSRHSRGALGGAILLLRSRFDSRPGRLGDDPTLFGRKSFSRGPRRALLFGDSCFGGSPRGLLGGTLLADGLGLRSGPRSLGGSQTFFGPSCFGRRFRRALLFGDSRFGGSPQGLLRGTLLIDGYGLRSRPRSLGGSQTFLGPLCLGRRFRRALLFGDSRFGGSPHGLLRGTLLIDGPGLGSGPCSLRGSQTFLGGFRFRSGPGGALFLGNSSFGGKASGLLSGTPLADGISLGSGPRALGGSQTFLGPYCVGRRFRRAPLLGDSRFGGSPRGLLSGTLLIDGLGLRSRRRSLGGSQTFLGPLCLGRRSRRTLLFGDS